MANSLNIIAIDPSLNCTGMAFQSQQTAVIRPGANLRGVARLVALRDTMIRILKQHKPDAVALEDYSYGSKGASVISIGEWGGVLRVLLHELSIPVAFVSPSSLKQYCCGKGNAKKEVVISEISNRSGRTFGTSDEAEAWGLAALAYEFCGEPWIKMPTDRHKAWVKVAWPEVLLSRSIENDRKLELAGR